MFESVISAVLAHKHVVIAAIAITGLTIFSLPSNMRADAQIVIDRIIEIPCSPPCPPEAEPEDVAAGDDIIETRLAFRFVPST
jgi:hypothetical protein